MQVGDALGVVDAAVRVGLVVVGRAVLGDVEGQARGLAGVAHQQLVQARRVDAPAHRRALARRLVEGDVVRARPGGVVAGAVAVGARAGQLGPGRADQGRGVVVQAQRVQLLVDQPEVAVQDVRPVRDRRRRLEQRPRVRAVQDRAVEDAVGEVVDLLRGGQVGGALREGPYHRRVEADGHRVAGRHRRAQRRGAQAVRQVQMVGGAQRGRRVGAAGGVHAGAVAEEGAAPGLVERDPVLHAVAERLADDLRVLGETVRRVALRPAARVLQLLGEVPVVEGDGRLDAVLEQLVDQPAVEVQADLDGGAAAGGLHPGPGDREAVRRQAQVRHQGHVVAVAVVMVDSDVTGLAGGGLARCVTEGVPDGGRTAVLPHGPLDLVGGGRGAPEEAGRKGHRGLRLCGLRHGSAPIGGRVDPRVEERRPAGRREGERRGGLSGPGRR